MRRLFYLMNLLFALMLPVQVLAATVDDYKAAVNDTTFYDPVSDGLCNIAASGGGSLTGKDNREKIWNWLRGKGLSAEQAAGVVGNMQAESGFNPARNQGSTLGAQAWGLAQWDFGRRDTLVGNLLKNPSLAPLYDLKYGGKTDASTGYVPAGMTITQNDALILFELDYLYQESTNRAVTAVGFGNGPNEWAVLKKQTTVDNATVFWHNNFEVSNDSPQEVLRVRGGFAQDAFTAYSSAQITSGGTIADNTCSSSSAPTTNFTKTVLDYAWPDFKGSPFTTMMPKYATAVIADQAKGEYVGSPAGIDCGGFVTMLMIDSGFEPHYNALKGNTQAQYDWAKANWQDLGPGLSINPADLRPGDVAINPAEHTYVWVGTIAGFHSNIASASQGDRAPMAGGDAVNEPNTEWFRKK